MRLVTFCVMKGEQAEERVGALSAQGVVDLGAACIFLVESGSGRQPAPPEAARMIPADMIRFMEGGEVVRRVAEEALARVAAESGAARPVATAGGARVVYRRGGGQDTLSFEQHLKNALGRIGLEIPAAWYEIPAVYRSNHNSVIGPDDPILAPSYSKQLDYELEFGVFIGRKGKNIAAAEASAYIYGYTIFNDVSARDVQGKEMSLMLGPAKSKNFDNGNVIGPCITTADEIGDPYD